MRQTAASLSRTASIVITCFNYQGFVGSAIESALGQTRAPLEIIVVDDGSADGSREVIRSYGERVRPLLKENGGMASAINAGCRAASGDVVFLLDADDMLCPDAIETVLGQWREGTVMTQSRLAITEADGRRILGTLPPPGVPLDEGDVRARMLRNGSYSMTLTSGLAFDRRALLEVLPIPEETFRAAADGYLVRAMPFHGPVQAINRPLALYRLHTGSEMAMGSSEAELGHALRKRIRCFHNELGALEALALRHGFEVPARLCERNPDYLFTCLSSLVTDPHNHPVPGDTRWHLASRFAAAFLAAPPPLGVRTGLYVGVAAGATLLPRRFGRRLISWWCAPATRPGWFVRLNSWRRRRRAQKPDSSFAGDRST